jgi:hypothetical protein
MTANSANPGSAAGGEHYLRRPGPVLNLKFRLSGSPLRMGPAWAVIAGAVAGHAPIVGAENLLQLAGALLLADAVWGVFWPQIPLRRDQPTDRSPRRRLPYSAFESPLSRILSVFAGESDEAGDEGWHGILGGLVLAAITSLLLGRAAILLSSLALAVSLGARFLSVRGRMWALCVALLSIGLPWALGASLGWTPGTPLHERHLGAPLAVGAAFTVLAWMSQYVRVANSWHPARPVWVGQILVLMTLVAVQEPLALAVMGCLAVVPGLWLSRKRSCPQQMNEAMANSEPWWLASMLVSALAVRS